MGTEADTILFSWRCYFRKHPFPKNRSLGTCFDWLSFPSAIQGGAAEQGIACQACFWGWNRVSLQSLGIFAVDQAVFLPVPRWAECERHCENVVWHGSILFSDWINHSSHNILSLMFSSGEVVTWFFWELLMFPEWSCCSASFYYFCNFIFIFPGKSC